MKKDRNKISKPFILLLLQICVLLFICLYIVSYLILTHFKKNAEFVTGEHASQTIIPALWEAKVINTVIPARLVGKVVNTGILSNSSAWSKTATMLTAEVMTQVFLKSSSESVEGHALHATTCKSQAVNADVFPQATSSSLQHKIVFCSKYCTQTPRLLRGGSFITKLDIHMYRILSQTDPLSG